MAPSTSPATRSLPRLMLLVERPRARGAPARTAVARTFERDVIAARSAATPSRRSISARFWPYWPNSIDGEPVVVEGEHGLRRARSRGDGSVAGLPDRRCCARPLRLPPLQGRRRAARSGRLAASVPNRRVDSRRRSIVDRRDRRRSATAGADHVHRLQIGRPADDLARMAARLFEQHVASWGRRIARLNAACCGRCQRCSRCSALRLHRPRKPAVHVGGGRAGARRILERSRRWRSRRRRRAAACPRNPLRSRPESRR